jgi:2'-5' RNA ligase
LRAFVALEISDDKVLDSIVSFQRELAATGADLKLVDRQNLHFTLKFLGEIPESMIEEADRRLKGLRLGGSTVSVTGVGAFPSVSRPNVVWVGMPRDDAAKARPIAEAVIGALEGIGERDRRPFEVHLTLARVRSGRNREELTALIEASSERPFGVLRLTTIALKSSQLTPSGPVYSDLGVYNLS